MKKIAIALLLFLSSVSVGVSQVTTSAISGVVKSNSGEALVGATVQTTHTPTGTQYYATTNILGQFVVPAVRPGGPYTVVATYIGFTRGEVNGLNTVLGVTANVEIVLNPTTADLGEVVVTSTSSNTFSAERTGASLQLSRRVVNSIPTLGSRTISSLAKYSPYGDGRSFGAQDSRMNNFTIDGSQFNNGFGLGSSSEAGGRTGSSAISLDAIDQIQLNVAPYDIRQSGFLGAGINAVTRSGTNQIEGSVYRSYRDNTDLYVGRTAAGVPVTASKFNETTNGIRLGLPIVKNRLFFFGNIEGIERLEPGTNWISDGSPLSGSQVSRVKYSDMETLSNFMREKFGYETGPWEGYDNTNASFKGLVRLDWNINRNHKLTARYVHHDSDAEINISNSSSAGAGNRTAIQSAMSFKNSGYVIMDNTRSSVLELNSKFSDTFHNSLIVGYDKQIEDRAYLSQMFPTIDIREGSTTYTSVGFDPFTPSNKLNYTTFHITNNFTKYAGRHTFVGGVRYERYKSNNLFYPASNGVYIFNSLADFYTAANQSLAAGGAPSAFAPARFQLRYSALEGAAEPLQTLEVDRFDVYGQDEWQALNNLRLTFGLRASVINLDRTEMLENPAVSAMTFANGETFNTSNGPKSSILWEPRVGFNYDVFNNQITQLRGGSGIFTGRPPYVFLSNSIGNNGVLTGFIDVSGANAANYGFTARPNDYFVPNTPTLPSTFDLAFTATDYKFPQVWKTNVAIDQQLPFGFVASAEYLYNKGLNSVHYYNANLDVPTGTFSGTDNRPMYARNDAGVRVNDNVSMGAVLTTRDDTYYDAVTLKLEQPFKRGFWGSVAYTKSEAKDYMSAGSIASGSWQGIRSVNGNNNIGLSFSDNDVPTRLIGLLGYRLEYGGKRGGATTFTLGYVGQDWGRYSYTIAGDMNGDRVNNNDLLYIPTDASEILFEAFSGFTVDQQRAAFNSFIEQDPYLSSRRGQYAERNGAVLPFIHRVDASVTQEFHLDIKGKRNTIQVRADILNVGNLINSDWGVTQRAVSTQPLQYRSLQNGQPVYRMATQRLEDGSTVLLKDSFANNSSVFDVWTGQLTVRYIFGR